MKRTPALLILIAAVFAVQACYSSHSPNDEDAADDVIHDNVDNDVITDTTTDDAVTDTVTDEGVFDVDPDVPPARYRLHEWGVMVMDGDGASIHGPSPEFSGFIPAKPVIYLYANEEISPVNIGVSFASGASTEVWPEIPLGPHVMWNNLVLRPGPCETTPFPVPYMDDDPVDGMCEACNLALCVAEDATCLTFTDPAGATTISKLLFYTGRLPDYRSPLSTTVSFVPSPEPDDVEALGLSISNNSSYNIEDIWFIYRQTQSTRIDPSACPVVAADIAWSFFDNLSPSMGMATTLGIRHFEVEVDEHGFPVGEMELPAEWLNLGKDLTAKLIERGLTESEAGAFLRNWDTVFFGLMGSDTYYIEPFYQNGAFLIYFMNNEDYDAQLPLIASPPPTETVRVGMIYENVDL